MNDNDYSPHFVGNMGVNYFEATGTCEQCGNNAPKLYRFGFGICVAEHRSGPTGCGNTTDEAFMDYKAKLKNDKARLIR